MPTHLLVTNDYPPKTGGIQVYLHELWRRLEDGRAHVLTASSHPDAAAFDASTNVVVERVPQSTLFFPTRRARRAIEDAIARHNPDLVLLDPAWPLGRVGRSLSRPYGVILHGAEVTIPGRLPLLAGSLRRILRHAVVAVCAGTYPEAEARRNAKRHMPPVVQVPPGVDVQRFVPLDPSRRDEVRARLGLEPTAFLVTSYSRLVPRKGMDVLLRAAVLAQRSIPNLQIAIGGSGRDRPRLEKLARRLGAPVVFLGRVADEDLVDFVGASDVMAMNCRSRWFGFEQEGFGIVFVEAAACGVAAIAGRSGGSHEAVADGVSGLVLAHPKRPRDLADALVTLSRDPATRARYGAEGRAIAEASFDWNVLVARLREGLAAHGG